MTKQLQITTPLSNLKLSIVDILRESHSLRFVADKLGLKENALSYHISTLKKAGLVEKIGYGTWISHPERTSKQLQIATPHTPPGLNTVRSQNLKFLEQEYIFSSKHLPVDFIRGHGFIFRFKIRPGLRNWGWRGDFLRKYCRDLKPKQLSGGWGITFEGRKVHLWDRSVVVYESKSFYDVLASGAYASAVRELLSFMNRLEGRLKADLRVGRGFVFRVARHHYSMIKNALAKYYRKDKAMLKVFDQGKLWLMIDNSHNLHEKEIISNEFIDPVETSEAVQSWWNDHKKHGFTVTPSFILEVFKGYADFQKAFNENLMTHLDVLRELGVKVKELGDGVNNFIYVVEEFNGKKKKITPSQNKFD